ncbi:MAG TPA: c-type cytochrome biogenesis protein CcmI [Pyrinomonadaceae bacterium]|nr:c-type cytochrome biogenesis protein CcmI [Pyrinomonadaceae bacterium]
MLFWLICAAMVAIALAFVLPPLLKANGNSTPDESKGANIDVYRDQLAELEADLKNGIVAPEQYQLDRDAIERRMLEDVDVVEETTRTETGTRSPAYAVALAIPLIAVAFYLQIGNPWSRPSGRPQTAEEAPAAADVQPNAGMTQQSIEANVANLAKRLEQSPNDAEGWMMLARSYSSLEKYKEASGAYAKATALKTDDADLWADYAFALAMANGRSLRGAPEDLIKKSLRLDPNNPKAMELAGSSAFEAKNYKQAIDYWQRLLSKTPPGSELAQTLSQRIDQAKGLNAAK